MPTTGPEPVPTALRSADAERSWYLLCCARQLQLGGRPGGLIYLIGFLVVILFVLSFLGLWTMTAS
jgi:hypothetical protein